MRKALLVLLLLAGPNAARNAAACSCDGVIPPCAAAWRADAVFIGTAVEQIAEPVGGTLSWHVTRVSVQQPLRGEARGSITLVPAVQPSAEQIANSTQHPGPVVSRSSCDYSFEPGRRYVIYATRTADGRWSTTNCSGTKPIEQGAADPEYFAGLSAAAPGRVYGSIDRMILDPSDPSRIRTVPAAGVPVTLTSGVKETRITTDREGKIDVAVPPGEYTIAPAVGPTSRVYGARAPMAVAARGCAPVRLSLVPIGDEIEEQLAANAVEGHEAELVDDQYAHAEQPLLQTGELAGIGRFDQLAYEIGGSGEEHASFLLRGFDAERDREMRLPVPIGPAKIRFSGAVTQSPHPSV